MTNGMIKAEQQLTQELAMKIVQATITGLYGPEAGLAVAIRILDRGVDVVGVVEDLGFFWAP